MRRSSFTASSRRASALTDGGHPAHQPTVVQHEGWLYKRGAGYAPKTALAPHAKESAPSPDSDEEHGPAPGGVGGRPSARGGLASLFTGSGEKRRYFMLVTTQARQAKGASASGEAAPRAELRYYVKGRPENTLTVRPKGVIVLTADMRVEQNGSQFMLRTTDRTFYLRPDVPDGQGESAKARTSAAQWMSGIKFALQGLRAWELAGAEGSHPMQDRRSVRVYDAAAVLKALGPGGGAAAAAAGGGAPVATDSPFLDVWANYGIQGYNATVAYFGPVQTDLQRIVSHFASRLAQCKAELAVHEHEAQHSLEIVVKEQKSVADAMRELYKTTQRHAVARRAFAAQLQKEVVDPLKFEAGTLAAKLDAIVAEHAAAANYVDAARKSVQEAERKVAQLQDALALATRAAEAAAAGGGAGAAAPAAATAAAAGAAPASAPAAPHFGGARRRSEAAPPDPQAVEEDLNAARQDARDAAQVLTATEAKSAQSITQAMRALEELERSRIATVLRCSKRAAELELELVTALCEDAALMDQVFNDVDGAKDIRASFAKLKAAAEKVRPNNRHRRANSLMRRNEFLKSVAQPVG